MKYRSFRMLIFPVLAVVPLLSQDISILLEPQDMYRQTDTIWIGWTGADKDVQLRCSTIPDGGKNVNHYSPVHIPSWQGSGIQSFVYGHAVDPQYLDSDLKIGVNYCILTSQAKKSAEFKIIMESNTAPNPISPANEALVEELTPEFKWSGNSPYYSVLISDEPFTISPNNTLLGFNAVWLGTTQKKSIRYGEKLNIGFNFEPPPLIEGKTYYWIVLNNYDPAVNAISTVVLHPHSFTCEREGPEKAVLIHPANRDTLATNDPVVFRWSPVEGAVSYRVDLLEENLLFGISTHTLIWKKNINRTEAILTDPNGLLRRLKYQWRVYAYDNQGRASVSKSREFFNKTPAGRIKVRVYEESGVELPFTQITFNRLPGLRHAVVAEASTGNAGFVQFDDMPYRIYSVKAEKEGYASKSIQFELNSERLEKTILLRASRGNIFGNITGKSTKNQLASVLITLTSLSNPDETPKQQLSSHTGDFSFEVPFGVWRLNLAHDDYTEPAERTVSLNTDNKVAKVNYILDPLRYKVSGSVINSYTGEKIYDASVLIIQAGTKKRFQTLEDGAFSLPVQSGEAEIICQKAGFSTRTFFWNITSNTSKTLLLDPGASNISGIVSDAAQKHLSDVVITAISESRQIATRTTRDGYYRFSLPAGNWQITAEKEGYVSHNRQRILLEYGQDVLLDFNIQKSRSIITGQLLKESPEGLHTAPGATVRILEIGLTAKTDNQGRYRLPVEAGTYTLAATLSGFSFPGCQSVYIAANDTLSGIDFIGTGNAANVSGVVQGPAGPAPAVKIHALNLNTGTTAKELTNNRGRYKFSLTYGKYNVWAEKEGYISDTLQNVILSPHADLSFQNIRLLKNSATIFGIVQSGGTALLGASCLVEYSVFTRNNSVPVSYSGEFQFEVEAEKPVWVKALCRDYLPSAAIRQTLAVNEMRGLKISVIPSESVLNGTVFSSGNNTSLPGVKAELREMYADATQWVMTDNKGSYHFNLVAGRYLLKLSKPGFSSISREILVEPGKSPKKVVDYLIHEEGDLIGQVTGISGNLLSQVSIHLERKGFSLPILKTEENGCFRFNNLSAGFYSLTATRPNFYEMTRNIFIEARTVSQVSLKLEPWTAGISGRVNKKDGSPMENAQIIVQSSELSKSAYSGAGGKYQFDSLPEGEYSVSVFRKGYYADTVYSGHLLGRHSVLEDLQFTMQPFDGMVTVMPEGIFNTAILDFRMVNNAVGHEFNPSARNPFKFELPAGIYSLRLLTPGYTLSQETEIPVSGNLEYKVTVKRDVKPLSGRVINQDGSVVNGLKIRLQPITGDIDEASTVSDASGKFSFDQLPAGAQFKTGCVSSRYKCRETIFTVGKAASLEITAEDYSSTLSGTVTLDGKKRSDIRIQVLGSGNLPRSVYPKLDGSFQVLNLKASAGDKITLAAAITGVPPAEKIINLKAGESKTDIHLALKTVLVSYRDQLKSLSRSLTGKKVIITEDGKKDTLKTDEEGRFGLPNMRPGDLITVQTLLDTASFDNVIKTVTLGNSEIQDFETIVTERNSQITVNTSEPKCLLAINDTFKTIIKSKSYISRHLPAGKYRVSIVKPGYFPETDNMVFHLDGTADSKAIANFQFKKINSGIYGEISEMLNGIKRTGRSNIRLLLTDTLSHIQDTAYTSHDGSYYFTNTKPGVYRLSVSLPGFLPVNHLFTLSNNPVQLYKSLSAYKNSLSGRIRSDTTVNLRKVRVILSETGGEKLETHCNSLGDYAFLNLKSGRAYTAIAEFGSLSTRDSTLLIQLGKTARFDGDLRSLPDIQGTVKSENAVLNNVYVSLIRESDGNILTTNTNASGAFRFPGVTPGQYSLKAEKTGFINTTGDRQIFLEESGIERNVIFHFKPCETGIYGNAKDTKGRAVDIGIFFIRDADTSNVKTGFQGDYIFKTASQGKYRVLAAHTAYEAIDTVISLPENTFQEFNILLTPLKNRFSGRVLSAYDNSPIPVKTVVYFTTEKGESDSTIVGKDGGFSTSFSKPPGAFIEVYCVPVAGYEPLQNQKILLDDNGSVQQDFNLTPIFTKNGSISLYAFSKGTLLKQVTMILRPDASESPPRVNTNNPAIFSQLRVPGSYQIFLKRDGFPDISAQYRLNPETKNLKDSLSFPSGQYFMELTADGKKPLSAKVFLNEHILEASAEKPGTYSCGANLKAGKYHLSVTLPEVERVPLLSFTNTLGEGETRLNKITMPWTIQHISDTTINSAIPVTLAIEPGFNIRGLAPDISANLFYLPVEEEDYAQSQMKLSPDSSSFQADIPRQKKPGIIKYYFTIHYRQGIFSEPGEALNAEYSNASQPLFFKVIDPDILKAVSFSPIRLEAGLNRVSAGSELPLTANLFGEAGRNLNKYFEDNIEKPESFSITWSLDPERETMEKAGSKVTSNGRRASFQAGDTGSLKLFCTVKLNTISIRKSIEVEVVKLKAEKMLIRFENENRLLEKSGTLLEISNRNPVGYQFYALGVSNSQEEFYISPAWSLADSSNLDPTREKALSTGIFYPDSSVACQDTLTALDKATGMRFHAVLQTYLRIEPAKNRSVKVSNGRQAWLEIPLDGLESGIRIDFVQPEMSKMLLATQNTEVMGDIVDIKLTPPQPFKPKKGAYVSLPLAKAKKKGKVFMGHWNSKNLEWDVLETDSARSNDSLITAWTNAFSPFALHEESRPLGAYGFKVRPNPFTPMDPWALQLEYEVSSTNATAVGIVVEVFNMRGDRVYRSNKNILSKYTNIVAGMKKQSESSSPHERLGELALHLWDGRTTEGKLCRNGRYILKLTVSDLEGQKTYLKKVVLLK